MAKIKKIDVPEKESTLEKKSESLSIEELANLEIKKIAKKEKTNQKSGSMSITDLVASEDDSKKSGEKPIIYAENLNKTFIVGRNKINILKGVNVEIFAKEFIVILGPSGSGKSTLMNSILGLEPPTSGKVVVKDQNLANQKPNKLSKFRFHFFGIVFQRPEWVRTLTVIQNVALPLAIDGVSKKERRAIALKRLEEVGMQDHAEYYPTELSGGQQQKVTLARALVNNPDIIVADEPTGNLDTKSADLVMNMFKDLNEKEGKTILMVTHNIDYVRYASRTIYIRDGRVVQGAEQFII